jgi:DNA-binding MarR family transcriptional regulator
MRKLFMGVFHSGTVNQPILTKNEKKVLNGICRHPNITDSELSDILQVKLSTLTSIKRRLAAQGYYRSLCFPLLNRLGCELLAVIYMQFNPVIPLKERVETTKRTIEVFDEIFFSVGEEEKGFSISLSQNYTNIGRINEIRTETFGKLGLLEKEYPHEVIFPFETSHIHKFFDFSSVLQKLFELNDIQKTSTTSDLFRNVSMIELTAKEKKVYSALVEHPTATTQQIGDLVGLSRHTVARMKKQFFEDGLLQVLILPNLKILGVDILTFYHISFNPNKAPSTHELSLLNSPSTVFFASRKFETVLLSAYPTYQEYKEDEMNKIRFLKENNLFSHPPFISTYMFEGMELIKEFDFAPLVRKILGVSS